MNNSAMSKLSLTNCPSEDVLLDLVAGRLAPAQAEQFGRHAGECSRCASLRKSQAAMWHSLEEWKPAPVSAGFNRELWRRIDADAISWRSIFGEMLGFGFWRRLAPLAVAVALVATAFVFDHSGKRPGERSGSASAVAVVTVSDADQLERALDDIQLLHDVDAESAAAKPVDTLM